MYNPDTYYYITSIDIGVKNLGISLISLNKNFTINQVEWIDLIDITEFVHLDIESETNCKLYHDKTYTDYLEHVFYLHHNLFKISNWIILERQPPQGYVVVEQLIFSKYRDKTILVSPNSVHCFFGWTRNVLNYEQRKEKSIRIAKQYITKDYLCEEFETFSRQHDIADTICIAIYWIHKQHTKWIEEERQKRIEAEIEHAKENGLFHTHLYLEKFRFCQ